MEMSDGNVNSYDFNNKGISFCNIGKEIWMWWNIIYLLVWV